MATFQALRHPNYRRYFLGQAVSLTGSWMQTTALVWLVDHSTRQTSWVAWINTATVLPLGLLSLLGGTLADHYPRRPLILCTQTVQLLLSLSLACLALTGLGGLWGLLLVSLLVGTTLAIDTPARLAFLIELVGREDLPNAIALNSLTFNLARLLGPALAGLALPLLGPAGCFLINALTFAAVLFALLTMHLPPPTPAPVTTSLHQSSAFATLRHRPHLILLLVLAATVAFTCWPVATLLPALVRSLGQQELGYGLAVSAIGGGALLGALLVASWRGRRWHLLAIGVALTTLAPAALACADQLGLLIACCFLVGLGMILFFATAQTILQVHADEQNRGQIMGVWLTVLAWANPAGHLTAGHLADHCGPRWTLLALAGTALALVALLTTLALLLPPPPAPPEGK